MIILYYVCVWVSRISILDLSFHAVVVFYTDPPTFCSGWPSTLYHTIVFSRCPKLAKKFRLWTPDKKSNGNCYILCSSSAILQHLNAHYDMHNGKQSCFCKSNSDCFSHNFKQISTNVKISISEVLLHFINFSLISSILV